MVEVTPQNNLSPIGQDVLTTPIAGGGFLASNWRWFTGADKYFEGYVPDFFSFRNFSRSIACFSTSEC